MISWECSRENIYFALTVSQSLSHLLFLILSQGEAIMYTKKLSIKVKVFIQNQMSLSGKARIQFQISMTCSNSLCNVGYFNFILKEIRDL